MKPGRIPMGGMNMNALMKQAQKMQDNIKKLQEELENREYTATSGGGAVTAVVKSKQVKPLTISPEVIDPEDAEMLSDLILAAVNSALKEAEDTYTAEMGKITGGMGGLF